MQPGDRLICAFVQPMHAGDLFRQWPLHITIVAWFRVEDSTERIVTGLKKALLPIRPFHVVMDGAAAFGPHHSRPARLVQLPTTLSEVEHRVRRYLHKKRAWLVDETTKVTYAYRPHVTAQVSGQSQAGDRFMCDRLYVVAQAGDYKEIVGEVQLAHE